MQRHHLYFLLILLCSCNLPRKCCPDQFKWTFNSQHIGTNFSLALIDGEHLYITDGSNPTVIELFNTREKKWNSVSSIPYGVNQESGVLLDHCLYLMGGIKTDSTISGAFQKLDLNQMQWTKLPDLSASIYKAASVTYQNKIYLIGGITSSGEQEKKISNSIQVFDPKSGKWNQLAGMPAPRFGHSAIVINDMIIVAGGYESNGLPFSQVFEYDPVSDQWARKADVMNPTGYLGLFTIKGRTYAIHGIVNGNESRLVYYDPVADQWTDVDSVPQILDRFGIASDYRQVYLVGGKLNFDRLIIGKKI